MRYTPKVFKSYLIIIYKMFNKYYIFSFPNQSNNFHFNTRFTDATKKAMLQLKGLLIQEETD